MAKNKSHRDRDDEANKRPAAGSFSEPEQAVTDPDLLSNTALDIPASTPSVAVQTGAEDCTNKPEAAVSKEDIQDKLSQRQSSASVSASGKENVDFSSMAEYPPSVAWYNKWQIWRKGLISLFIAWNLVSIGFHLCAPSIFRDRVLNILNPYLWYTGLWQDFCVFAPNPKDYNIQMAGCVYFKNGERRKFLFPNPAKTDFFTAMTIERFRKWAHDNVNQPAFKVWWPDTCRWIARKYMQDPNNPPVKIELVRQFQAINPPGSKQVYGAEQQVTYYTYELQEDDFEKINRFPPEAPRR